MLDSGEELGSEPSHLSETDTKNGGLGVTAKTETVDESGSKGYNVLQCSGEGNTVDVFHSGDSEGWCIEDCVPEGSVVRVWCTDCSLAELAESDFEGNVGAGKCRAGKAELFLDKRSKCCDLSSVDLYTLDGGDGTSTGGDCARDALEVGDDSVKELVGSDKDDECGVLDNIDKVWNGTEVLGKLDVGEIPRVEVGLVDHVGELLAVDLGC